LGFKERTALGKVIDLRRDGPEHLQIVAVPKPVVLNRSVETVLHRKIRFAVGFDWLCGSLKIRFLGVQVGAAKPPSAG
jgi:hypothetical protein